MTQKILIAVFLLLNLSFTLMTIIDIGKHLIEYKVNNKIVNCFNIHIEIIIVSVLWSIFYILNHLDVFN